SGWRNLPTQGQRSRWQVSGHDDPVEVEHRVTGGGSTFELTVDGTAHTVRRLSHGDDDRGATVRVEVDGIRTTVALHRIGEVVWANSPSGQQRLEPLPRFVDHDAEMAAGGPVAPLPGTIVS